MITSFELLLNSCHTLWRQCERPVLFDKVNRAVGKDRQGVIASRGDRDDAREARHLNRRPLIHPGPVTQLSV